MSEPVAPKAEAAPTSEAPTQDTPTAPSTLLNGSAPKPATEAKGNETLLSGTKPDDVAPVAIAKGYLKEDGSPDADKLWKQLQTKEEYIRKTRPSAAKTVDEYQYEFKDEDQIQVDAAVMGEFKTKVLEQGFSPTQFNFIMDKYKQVITETSAVVARQFVPTAENASKVLLEKWGDEFQPKLEHANRAWSTYAPEGTDISADPFLGNNPVFIEILARIGAELGEDQAPSATTPADSSLSPEEIVALVNSADYWKNEEKQRTVQKASQARR